MQLEGLDPGASGYADALLQRVPTVAAELQGMYDPALISGIPSPGGSLVTGAEAAAELIADIDRRFAGYNAFVAHANAAYVHASRLDAMEAMLGIEKTEDLVRLLGAALARAAELETDRRIAGRLPIVPARPMRELFGRACAVLGVVMDSYSRYQRELIAFNRESNGADELRARIQAQAQALHRAVGDLLDLPRRLPGVNADSSLVEEPPAILATLDGLATLLGWHDDPQQDERSRTLFALGHAIESYLESVRDCERALLAARAAYLELGRALDRAAGGGDDRFACELAMLAQVREALAVERGVRSDPHSPDGWAAWVLRVEQSAVDRGLTLPATARKAFSAVQHELSRYAGGADALERGLAGIAATAASRYGSDY